MGRGVAVATGRGTSLQESRGREKSQGAVGVHAARRQTGGAGVPEPLGHHPVQRPDVVVPVLVRPQGVRRGELAESRGLEREKKTMSRSALLARPLQARAGK